MEGTGEILKLQLDDLRSPYLMNECFGLVRVLAIFGDEGVEGAAAAAVRGIRGVLTSKLQFLA
jgi:hypothetical protein